MSSHLETHEPIWLKPKPQSEVIIEMVRAYFDAEAHHYDEFDARSEKRTKFTAAVNHFYATELKSHNPLTSLLSVGCGTGRRELELINSIGSDLSVKGVELSEGLAKQAHMRGIGVINAAWLDAEIEQIFDVVLFPYWFGLVPNRELRVVSFEKAYQCLRPGGLLFVDVLSLEDKGEWGPMVRKEFESQDLEQHGYELGDLFYRRRGGNSVGFHHYFSEEEICDLLIAAKLIPVSKSYIGYGKEPGKKVRSASEGAIVVKAYRR